MQLPQICIQKPVFTTVLSLILVAIGVIFFFKLPLRDTPNIDMPVITVSANYQGADAMYMEKQITKRLEKSFKTLKNLDFTSSNSGMGSSQITLYFKLDTDIEAALNDVRTKIAAISNQLPQDMDVPTAEKMDSDAFPSFWLVVSSSAYDVLELTRITDQLVVTPLEQLPSIGDSWQFGSRYYTMLIEPIITDMIKYGITGLDIQQAIEGQNKNYPAGMIRTHSRDLPLRLVSSLNTEQDFANIILKKSSDGQILRLNQVAKVQLAPSESNVFIRYNQRPSIAIGLIKQPTANIVELSDNVRKTLPALQKNLPPNVELDIAYDAAIPVKAAINSVYLTIFEAIVLVGLVTFLFLGSWRLTLIPLLTIPISLIASFAAMHMFGFSINNFTLLAMILAIGLVVDDAIVMLENIFRHCHEFGKTAWQASLDAADEIGFTIVAMTITLAAVFLPIGFVQGFMGKLFIEFAWTLAFCILFSGIVALTLTPMMASRMLQAKPEDDTHKYIFLRRFDAFIEKVKTRYVSWLELSLQNKKLFALICLGALSLLIVGFAYVNKEFAPAEDQGFLRISASGPEASTSNLSLQTAEQIEDIVLQEPALKGLLNIVGYGGGNNIIMFAPLKNWQDRSQSQVEIQQKLNQQLSQLTGMSCYVSEPRSMGGGGDEIGVKFRILSSTDYATLDKLAMQFLQAMKDSGTFINPQQNFNIANPMIEINIDRPKAYLYDLPIASIGNSIAYVMAGKKVGDFIFKEEIYDVIIRYQQSQRKSITDLANIYVKNTKGKFLPLSYVASYEQMAAASAYRHYNGLPAIKISSRITEGKTLAEAIEVLEKITDDLIDKSTTKIVYDGQIKQMQESSNDILITFGLSILFIFLVLAAQFESFGDSLLILVAVPFSIVGAVLILWLCQNSINLYSNIGIITLIGLVTKNSIMIVEFANQLARSGKDFTNTVITAATMRLRPILMTSIATICGALPLVFASGAGAGARNSIGLVIVGGMLVGTLFTIFVIPVLYHSFRRKKFDQLTK